MPTKKYQTKFTQILELSPWNKHFRCEFPDDIEFQFEAGQFVMAHVQRDGKLVKRAYSIASPPYHKRFVEFVITRVENGFMSNWFHARNPGDTVELEGPLGHFVIKQPLSDELIFVATGSGVAPFRSMIPQLLREGEKRPLWLILGVRYEDQILYRDEFETLTNKNSNFHFIPTISRPKNWTGEVGYVQEKLKKYISDTARKDLYICGLPNMVDDVKKAAEEMGFPKENVLYEKY